MPWKRLIWSFLGIFAAGAIVLSLAWPPSDAAVTGCALAPPSKAKPLPDGAKNGVADVPDGAVKGPAPPPFSSAVGVVERSPTGSSAPPTALETGLFIVAPSIPVLVAGTDGAAISTVELCLGKKSPDAKLALSLGGFTAADAQESRYSVPTKATIDVEGKATSLAPGKCVPVRIAVSGLLDAGPMTSTLRNEGSDVANITAVNAKSPFTLKVNGEHADRIDLTMSQGHPAKVAIRNLDDLTHRVAWVWELGGGQCSGSFMIGPRERKNLQVQTPGSDFKLLESGFLRTGAATGTLTLRRELGPGFSHIPLAPLEFPVTARLSFFSPRWQSSLNLLAIAFLLVLGVLASLLVNFALPMQRKRVDIKQRLVDCMTSLNGQGGLIGSRTLNVLRVEAGRLTALVESRWPFFPEVEALITRVTAQTDTLDVRIGLAREAGTLMAEAQANPDLTLHEAEAIAKRCRAALKVVEMGSPTADDLARAATELKAAQGVIVDAAGPPKAEAIATLVPRANAIKEIGAMPSAPDLKSALVATVNAKVWSRLTTLVSRARQAFLPVWPEPDKTTTTPPPITREAFVTAAKALWKAELASAYADLVAAAPTSGVYQSRLDQGSRLLDALTPGAEESAAEARRRLREIEQCVSSDDISQVLVRVKAVAETAQMTKAEAERALADGMAQRGRQPPAPTLTSPPEYEAAIVVKPAQATDFQLVQLSIEFRNPTFNEAEARKSFECIWTVDGQRLESTDLSMYYAFERKARFGVSRFTIGASVRSRKGELYPMPTLEFELTPRPSFGRSSTLLSAAGLAITVVAVVIGLVATAQDKLQSLEWSTGLLTVLALGFGADVVKRALGKT